MRRVNVSKIKDAVRELCLKANFELRQDILSALKLALKRETNPRAKRILGSIIGNAAIARKRRLAICQDTGMAMIHIELGQEVHLTGGSLSKAVNEGVKEAYRTGSLRKSIVSCPLMRKNIGTNTPASVTVDIVDGDHIRIEVAPKGFGSENKSGIKMLSPTASIEEIKEFIVDVVRRAGPDACPPLVIGVGIGSSFAGSAALAKRALSRPINRRNPVKDIARIEEDLLGELNSLDMGPMGLGGKTSVIGVNILKAPTHIAGLPVAVNVSCHATRSASTVL